MVPIFVITKSENNSNGLQHLNGKLNCDAVMQWNITGEWKGMSYWFTQSHGWMLNAFSWVKEVSLQKIIYHMIPFIWHFQKTKLLWQRKDWWWPSRWGCREGVAIMRQHKGVLRGEATMLDPFAGGYINLNTC